MPEYFKLHNGVRICPKDAVWYPEEMYAMASDGYQSESFKLEDLEKWLNGEKIQVCMPYLSEDDREVLISGLSPNQFNQMLPDEDDFEEDDDIPPY